MLRFKRRLTGAAISFFFVAAIAFAQTSTTPDQAKAAFTSNSTIGNVTLDGTFVSTEGSLRQEGNAHLVVGSDGTYSVALTKSSGATGEARTRTDSDVGCTWKDVQGNDHPVDWSNCQTPAWFLPELPVLLSSQTSAEWTTTTPATDGSAPHLKFTYAVATGTGKLPPPTVDMELSSTTLLPTKATFLVHADGKSNVNIPVMVTYQDYRQVSGVSIPFRIQKFVNGTLVLDMSVSSANVN
jgi:hypothetical protein